MQWIGVGYRQPLAAWLDSQPPEVGCLEITAEHFFGGRASERKLAALAERYPLFVHGLGLSLGTPGPLDQTTLDSFARVAAASNAVWVSEHIAFTRTREIDLGHLNPVPLSERSLEVVVDHALEIAARCGRKLILENIASELRVGGELAETEFLNLLCQRARCGLLLDVTNLFINSRNHGFDPLAWLHEIEPGSIVQLHVVGYTHAGGRYHDQHSAPIQSDLLELVQAVLEYAPVQAIILERDERLDDAAEIAIELRRLHDLWHSTQAHVQ